MQSVTKVFFMVILISSLLAVSSAFAAKTSDRGKIVSQGEDGSVCYELDVKDAEAILRNMEKMVEAGKFKAAFDAASGSLPGCMPENGYDRIFSIIEHTYKKLGQQAEKAGQLYDAFKYYIYPFDNFFSNSYYREHEKNYSLADAHRTMLAYAKAHPDDYKVVQKAVDYFKRWESEPPQLKEAKDLAMHGGDRLLIKEEKDYAAHKYEDAFEDLKESRKWFELADDDRRAQALAKKRGEALLAEKSHDAVEHAFDYYYDFNLNLEVARARANKLGDEAERKGDFDLAGKFYSLSGDSTRQDALAKKLATIQKRKERQQEQADSKRQGKFEKEQQSLEKELGF
jgi:hypothetical protein